MLIANLFTVFGLLAVAGVCFGASVTLQDMAPVMVVIDFFIVLIGLPLILSVRFSLKGLAVEGYVKRLHKRLGERGVVHWETIK